MLEDNKRYYNDEATVKPLLRVCIIRRTNVMAMWGARREALPCMSGRSGVPITRDRDRSFGKDRVTSCSPWCSLYVAQ
jgi:hypothetical protein